MFQPGRQALEVGYYSNSTSINSKRWLSWGSLLLSLSCSLSFSLPGIQPYKSLPSAKRRVWRIQQKDRHVWVPFTAPWYKAHPIWNACFHSMTWARELSIWQEFSQKINLFIIFLSVLLIFLCHLTVWKLLFLKIPLQYILAVITVLITFWPRLLSRSFNIRDKMLVESKQKLDLSKYRIYSIWHWNYSDCLQNCTFNYWYGLNKHLPGRKQLLRFTWSNQPHWSSTTLLASFLLVLQKESTSDSTVVLQSGGSFLTILWNTKQHPGLIFTRHKALLPGSSESDFIGGTDSTSPQ